MRETKDDLETANCVISELRMKLEYTEDKLKRTEEAKEEQTHLVQKHVITEKKLANEASTLLSTADEATVSLERLYSKLERKK